MTEKRTYQKHYRITSPYSPIAFSLVIIHVRLNTRQRQQSHDDDNGHLHKATTYTRPPRTQGHHVHEATTYTRSSHPLPHHTTNNNINEIRSHAFSGHGITHNTVTTLTRYTLRITCEGRKN